MFQLWQYLWRSRFRKTTRSERWRLLRDETRRCHGSGRQKR